jgi:hypothetical protein
MIKFPCPHCDVKIDAEPEHAGATANCPTCGGELVVPEVASEPAKVDDSDTLLIEEESSDKDSGESGQHAESGVEYTAKQPFAERVRVFARDGWAGLRTQSKQIALKTEIEKLRNVDLRRARRNLGEKCFDVKIFSEKLAEQYQAIRDVDAAIALNREFNNAEVEPTKRAFLQRKGNQVVMAGQAKALLLKRQRLLTELGTAVFLLQESETLSAITAERDVVEKLEQGIRDKEHEMRAITEDAQGKSRGPMMALVALLVCLVSITGIVGMNMLADDDKSHRSGGYDVEAAMLEDANRLANSLQSSSSGRQCGACNGAGHRGGKGCPTCTVGFGSVGEGTVTTPSGHVIVCSRCQGSGTVPITCGTCGGSGSYR